ncbi:hypothetical protein [Brevundimonas sp. SL130]|nr:hypothetical protein [Brevundimonas sp. SL130]WAC59450.1 hypothetical protein OU998_14715 [Brevundimonas sp. SL130]
MARKSDRLLMIMLGMGAVAAAVSFVSIFVLFAIAMFGVFFG